jgi:23S rRNA (uracil1939-C5)-methyltransferase
MGMIEPWGYRNHVRFSLGRKYGDVGFTHRGTRRLLRVDACDIAHPAIVDVLHTVQRRCIGLKAHQIMVRYGANTGDLLINPALPSVPELETGQTELTEQLLDRTFTISTAAFFQVNTKRERRPVPESFAASADPTDGMYSMADLLALCAIRRLEPQPDDVVVDAYCGVGTFSALLAPHVGQVLGVEESAAAVANARRNTPDLENVRFLAAKVEDALAEMTDPRPNAVIIDPSRVGCAPQVVEALIQAHPERLVYVSCDPATLARDLRILRDGGYAIQQVEPIDMFPQTYHIETVTTLRWGR